jgi:hypothetical protein
LAEAEAENYAETLDYGYLGLAQAYQLADEIGHEAEVYPLVRNSHLAAEEYVTGFFDTGLKHQENVDEPSPVQQPSTATNRTEPDHERPQGTM